ncbi:Sodium/glutamate symporter [Candidatus Kinetoplastibacterium sorsogonicusi]|uniref:Sodium/glutamate symporter n=1 Tax=Candidatus Kinetoplastidibacterium kentomonadis TaxID=1576550 RepID=A0A3Q8EX80_9PROT|nr:sodium/glutamate symporter [Candidatus Kinetoplastibacterium sorsogonicusi]AWD32675.1 Sodium/glutamate symporter [Candidatus Kinetoplastibacterium sorsogonicusi]
MISLSSAQSLLACCLVLMTGRFMTNKIQFLSRYSIPESIIGGLSFAILNQLLISFFNTQVNLEITIKPNLLLMFFGCIGLTANLKLLNKGGTKLIGLVIVLLPFLIFQNIVGLLLANILDMHPLMGLLGGTITLVGGHGTGAAYAVRFADVNSLQDIMALAMTSATMGLIFGGVLGGPVAEWLINHYNITTPYKNGETNKEIIEENENIENNIFQYDETSSASAFITSLCAALVTLVVGSYFTKLVEHCDLNLPNFLWCLAIGIIIRNIGPYLGLKLDDRVTGIVGAIMLSIFLAMTMMTLDLASVVRLAGPLAIILIVQAIFCVSYCCLIVFRVLRRDYEAAVISGAFCGIGLGTTATAIANMQSITKRHGNAPQSFIVVPITGAFLVDIMNVVVLTSFISFYAI